jgi:excisionase family DNA binding protein
VNCPGRIGPTDEVTLTEAAELLGLSPDRVNRLVEAGELPARTNFSVIRISLDDIEVYRLPPSPRVSAF